MTTEPATIRGLGATDGAFIRGLIARQGWNGGHHDVETFAAADPGAWLVAEVEGRPVGVTLATRWNDAFGWIGVYLVEREFRGRGIGLALFVAALDRLEPRSVGLDGDPRQQDNYRRSGFVDVHGVTRWHGSAGAWARDGDVVRATEVAFEDMVELDARALGSERRALLGAWIEQPEAVSVAAVRGGHVDGFATARSASDGWKIGPVHAFNAEVAATVIAGAVAHLAPDTTCWLDTPAPNTAATDLLRAHGYEDAPTSGRMVRGTPPPADLGISFAITAHEVG